MQVAFPVCFHGQIELIVGSFWGIRLMQSPVSISRGLPSTGNNSGNSSPWLSFCRQSAVPSALFTYFQLHNAERTKRMKPPDS